MKPYFLHINILIIFLFLSIVSIGQNKQGNVWYFGDHAGIDFNNSTPHAIVDGALSYPSQWGHGEGTSSISDSAGNILFYSDGMTVWNKKHEIMQNGSGLLGNFSSTQSCIFVPQPNSGNRYFYLFTISSGFCCDNSIKDGLRYSKIDRFSDGGLGAVMATEKNIKVADTVAEKIAVTRHANGKDYWILIHKYFSNQFWAIRLTADGIKDTIISAIGSIHVGFSEYDIAGSQGQMKFSVDGSKVAVGATNGLDLLELFDFDKSTGIVSNFRPLKKMNEGNVYGVEFSADGSKLYASSFSYNPFGMDLTQYDLSNATTDATNASMQLIYNEQTTISPKGLQIGPDGKIYMISMTDDGFLSVINQPNIAGKGCNFQDRAIDLNGKKGSYGLPGFIAGFDYLNGEINIQAHGDQKNTLKDGWVIYPNPMEEYAVLKFNNSGNSLHHLKIYNAIGQICTSINNIKGNQIKIGRGMLAGGVYFFELLSDDNKQRFFGKLIVK